MSAISRTKVKDLLAMQPGQDVLAKGWVRTKRGNKGVAFIALNDGSTINNVQVVVDKTAFAEDLLAKITTGACIGVTGALVESLGGGQAVVLGFVNRGVGGAVDYVRNPVFPYELLDIRRFGEVECVDVAEKNLCGAALKGETHLVAELTVAASNKYSHRSEYFFKFREERVFCVFFGGDGVCEVCLPVYCQRGVVKTHATLRFWVIEIVAFVGEDGVFRKHRETMCEATGNDELPMVFACQFDGEMPAVGGAAGA